MLMRMATRAGKINLVPRCAIIRLSLHRFKLFCREFGQKETFKTKWQFPSYLWVMFSNQRAAGKNYRWRPSRKRALGYYRLRKEREKRIFARVSLRKMADLSNWLSSEVKYRARKIDCASVRYSFGKVHVCSSGERRNAIKTWIHGEKF